MRFCFKSKYYHLATTQYNPASLKKIFFKCQSYPAMFCAAETDRLVICIILLTSVSLDWNACLWMPSLTVIFTCALKRPDGKTHCSPLTYMWHCPLNFHLGGVDGWWGAYTAKGKHEDPEQNEKRSLALHHLLHGQSFANPPLHHPVFSVQGPARQKTLSENHCWEPRLCHHAAHCGVDKEKSGCGSSEHMFQ